MKLIGVFPDGGSSNSWRIRLIITDVFPDCSGLQIRRKRVFQSASVDVGTDTISSNSSSDAAANSSELGVSTADTSVISSDGLGELDELSVAHAGVHSAAVAESEEDIGTDAAVSVWLNIDGVINSPCFGEKKDEVMLLIVVANVSLLLI